MPTSRPLPILCKPRTREVPRSFAWLDHELRRGGWLGRFSPRALSLYVFLVLAADEDGLSCWRLERVQREMPHLGFTDLHEARDELVALELVAYRSWSKHSPDGSYQVLSMPRQR